MGEVIDIFSKKKNDVNPRIEDDVVHMDTESRNKANQKRVEQERLAYNARLLRELRIKR